MSLVKPLKVQLEKRNLLDVTARVALVMDISGSMGKLGGGNDEPVAIKEVIAEYETSPLPAYVVFISDGGIYHEGEIVKLMQEASYLPIFWQFVGVLDGSARNNRPSVGGRFRNIFGF
ncbi:MAG: VWA domain-containing protein [Quinella sp. 2Q5]|nr:VWA domain-containing protein [Quinella sp. 2Q5]